jgi:membrane protein YqaA with SNARE-associated domain
MSSNPPETPAPPARRPGVLRSLYLWVLHWADTPYGTPALLAISFAESSFFPIPPDVLQIALSLSKPRRSFYYAVVAGTGSVLGAFLGWFIGYALWTTLGGFFEAYVPGCSAANIDYVGRLYHDNAFLAIVSAALTPIPYKVFTIAAGVFHEYVSLQVLIIASIIGRFGRFFLVGACIYFLGPSVKALLDKYLELAAFVLLALIIAGFVAIKYVF